MAGHRPQPLWSWRKRLDKARTKETTVSLVELAVRSPATPMATASLTGGRIEILLSNGWLVAIPVDVDPVALARLLDAVEAQQC